MVRIGFAGDVMIGRLIDEQFPKNLWGGVLPLLLETDLNIMNLECALTTHPHPVPKVFNFKSDPSHVHSLQEANITLVNLANNHILDFGEQGLVDTLNTLDAAKIQYVGAGWNRKEATATKIIESKGFTISCIGMTDNEPAWMATENSPGTNYINVGNAVTPIQREIDLTIASIHWGPNMRERPPKHFQRFAHALIDLGFDLIHGHSAHIFQGVEHYKQGLILYDTGDFVDDYMVDPLLRNDLSFFFIVEASKKGIQNLTLIPTKIAHFQTQLVQGDDLRFCLNKMRLLSRELNTELEEENGRLYLYLK